MSQMSKKQNSKTIVLDIETDGLLLDLTKMYVGVTYEIETEVERVWYDPREMVDYINREARKLVFHNGIGFDIPALNRICDMGIDSNIVLVDTLLLAKLVYYDKDSSFSNSLSAWGDRLGFPKGDHSDWTQYSKEMEEYCKRDVQVTLRLYKHLQKKGSWLPFKALDVEQKVQAIVTDQYINGWYFDTDKARKLHIELVEEKEKAEEELHRVFYPMYLPDGKVFTPKKIFKRKGITYNGPHQKIKLTEFNPGSGKHIVWWVERLYGEQAWKRTEKGAEKTDAETLMEMFSNEPWAKPLLHYIGVQKLLGMLAEGDNAWLKLVRDDNRIHHQVDILGTVSGRATHRKPNMSQVPSVRAYKVKEVRKLFTVPNDKVLVGCDLSGIELRCLAHYLNRYDRGNYGKEILKGDIHTSNQEAAGLKTRDQAKTFIYAFLYGAGAEKIGKIIGGNAKIGAALKARFLRKVPGLHKLLDAISEAAKRGYLVGITGRRLFIRSPHSAPNTLLQSLGAYVSKQWMIVFHQKLKEEGLNVKQLGWSHDELNVECDKEDAKRVAELLEVSAMQAGKELGIKIPIEAESKIGRTWYDVH